MAIDFPNSPTTNQIFTVGNRSWIWDGATWNIYSNVPNRYVQDAPPSSPQSGDQWFESDTGRLLIYYDSVWVEIGNATDIAGAIQPGQITALSAVTSLTTDDVFVVVDNPSSATAANKITYGNLSTAIGNTLGAWTTYTPTWTSSGTQPAIGNGTLTGRYAKIGKWVTVQVVLNCGTTTTYGTGNYYVSLPVTGATPFSSYASLGSGYAFNSATASIKLVGVMANDLSTTRVQFTGNDILDLGATSPFTWQNGCALRVNWTYEAA